MEWSLLSARSEPVAACSGWICGVVMKSGDIIGRIWGRPGANGAASAKQVPRSRTPLGMTAGDSWAACRKQGG